MQKRRFALRIFSLPGAAFVTTVMVAAGAPLSFAAGSGHGGGGGSGGSSAPHVSSQGINNSNGPNSRDRDTGLDRAQDRRSEEGLDHNKAKGPKSHASKKKPVKNDKP